MTLGERVLVICGVWRYDLKKMEALTGLKKSSVSRVCTGARKGQNLDSVAAIARALDVSIEVLRGTRRSWMELPDILAIESLEIFLDAQKDQLPDGMEHRLRAIATLPSAPKSKQQWDDFVTNLEYWNQFQTVSS